MTTIREQVLAAFYAKVAGMTGPTVRRNDPRDAEIPAGGLVTVRDGGTPPAPTEELLSPYRAIYDEVVEVELAVQPADPATREAALDTLLAALGTAINADRTLGGLADDLRAGLPAKDDEAVEGAPPIKYATVPVTITWSTTDALA